MRTDVMWLRAQQSHVKWSRILESIIPGRLKRL